MTNRKPEDDVDALLASLANQPLDADQKQLIGAKDDDDEDALSRFGERAGNFKIDPRDSHITGTDELRKDYHSLSVNPNDFTDRVGEAKESKRKRNMIIALGATVVLLGLGWLVYSQIEQNTAKVAYTIPTDDTEAQRFLNLYPNAPAADTTVPFSLVAEERGVAVPGGYALTFAGMDFQAFDYSVVAADDYGPAAIANVEGEWNGTQIYLFKDMAHSKAFVNAWDGSPVEVEGSPAAAVMLMELSTGVHAVLAIVNPDSSGFMIVLPQNLNYETAENLASSVRIEKSLVQASNNSTSAGVTPANFGNKCSPQYNVPAFKALGISTSEESPTVNAVSVPWGEGRFMAIKFDDGFVYRFTIMDGTVFPADELTHEEMSDTLNKTQDLSDYTEEEEELLQRGYEANTNLEEFKTLNACVNTITVPGQ